MKRLNDRVDLESQDTEPWKFNINEKMGRSPSIKFNITLYAISKLSTFLEKIQRILQQKMNQYHHKLLIETFKILFQSMKKKRKMWMSCFGIFLIIVIVLLFSFNLLEDAYRYSQIKKCIILHNLKIKSIKHSQLWFLVSIKEVTVPLINYMTVHAISSKITTHLWQVRLCFL